MHDVFECRVVDRETRALAPIGTMSRIDQSRSTDSAYILEVLSLGWTPASAHELPAKLSGAILDVTPLQTPFMRAPKNVDR